MSEYGAFSDDFYVNMVLGTEMDLPTSRESLLHHFEQIQKRYPTLINFSSRESGEMILEEEKSGSVYRWASIDKKRVGSGCVNHAYDSALEFHRLVLQLVPFSLSVSRMDCESLSIMMGFDFTFRGNHNEIVSEALGVPGGFEAFSQIPMSKPLSYEPAMQFSLDDQCKTQCRISVESRTTAYQVRTGEFTEDQISVYLTVRRFDSLSGEEDFVSEFDRLAVCAADIADEYLVPNVLRPLQQTISSHS